MNNKLYDWNTIMVEMIWFLYQSLRIFVKKITENVKTHPSSAVETAPFSLSSQHKFEQWAHPNSEIP